MNTDTAVFDEVVTLIRTVLDGYDLDGTPITRDTSLRDDLELESIDVVELSSRLTERYGAAINVPKFLSGLDLDQIIALRVGDLVGYIESCLAQA